MKTSSKLFALLGAAAALATIASADTVTFGPDNSNYRAGLGGEFTVFVNGSDPDNLMDGYIADGTAVTVGTGANARTGFETFCIQYNEHMNFNTTFQYGLSNAAKGPTGTDPISLGTAWLYSLFATHQLTGYDYTPGAGRAASAVMLQNAFWYLEDEIAIPSNAYTSNIFLADAIAKFGTFSGAHADANGAFGVEVLNLGSSQGNWDAQDQLVWPAPVPDTTATFGLVALALAGLVGFRRRFLK
jgi:hypothetical protein